MSIPTRGTKHYGGQQYVAGNPVYANDLEGDIAPLYALVSGGLEDDNISPSADIDAAKIDSHSTTDGEARQQTDPGTTANPQNGADLESEIQYLRGAIAKAMAGAGVFYMDGGVQTSAKWQEDAVIPVNLLRNSSFEIVDTGSAPANIPYDWADLGVGTPTYTSVTTGPENGIGQALQIVPDAATEQGISQTVLGLSGHATDNRQYLVGVRYKRAPGATGMRLEVTAGGSLDIAGSSVTWDTLAGIFTASASTVVIEIKTSGSAADDITIDHAFLYELGKIQTQNGVGYTRTLTTNVESAAIVGDQDAPGLTLAVTPDNHNCEIRVKAQVTVGDDALLAITPIGAQIKENGAGQNTAMVTLPANAGAESAATITMNYVNRAPAAGTTYTYTVGLIHDGTNDFFAQPDCTLIGQTTSELIVELVRL